MKTIKRLAGAVILSIPFVVIAAALWREHGFIPVVIVFGSTTVVVGLVILGVELLFYSDDE